MICAARLEQFGAPPKQRFCCLRGKATRAGETDVSLQGNAASSLGRWKGSRNRAVSAGYCMLAFLPLEVRCRAIGQQGIRLQFCLQSEGGYGTLPVRYALLKNALARLGTCTFLCAQGKRSTRRKPARLQARLAAWWNAGHCPLASSRCCGVRLRPFYLGCGADAASEGRAPFFGKQLAVA